MVFLFLADAGLLNLKDWRENKLAKGMKQFSPFADLNQKYILHFTETKKKPNFLTRKSLLKHCFQTPKLTLTWNTEFFILKSKFKYIKQTYYNQF